ncbi:uncharacterized protein G2W53_033642 [Senna tora]|uniref:Uncharacterized protein n=1 Tax=Senna tora TaxID=362788 RepID=A0A834SZS3_9FABA|nr:uncharacterized protein G2W53_033642 [Senna tora]
MIHAPPMQDKSNWSIKTTPVREPMCLTHMRNKFLASSLVKDFGIRPRFFVWNMFRHDPRSSHAMKTPIGASKPPRFANTTPIDVFDSLAQQVFCLVSEIRPRFFVRNILRHDPRSSHAKTTPIGASKPLRFANRGMIHAPPMPRRLQLEHQNHSRTDLFDSLAQQDFCLVSEIRPRFVVRIMLRHDPRSVHAKTTPIGASKPLRFANTTRTDVFDSLAQRVFCLVIRDGFRDPTAICRPEYVKTWSTLLPCQDDSNRSIKTTWVSEIRPRFFVWNMLRHDPRPSHAKTTPIGASKPLGSRKQLEPTCLTHLRNKSFASQFVKVSVIRS